jgi:hypothetical protein
MGKITPETKCGNCFYCMTSPKMPSGLWGAPTRNTGYMCTTDGGPRGNIDPNLSPADNFLNFGRPDLSKKIEEGSYRCGFITPEEHEQMNQGDSQA